MQIADLPGQNDGRGRIAAKFNFQNGLRGLRDRIAFPHFPKKNAPLGEDMFEVETEFPPVLGDTSPAPLCKRGTIRREYDDLLGVTRRMFLGVPNDIQGSRSQNRKYRCAMGSTTAGSQRSSRPSALTV